MAEQVDVDAVVIGSGAGGMTCAVALAQAGMKVVVLEQHYLPGGWCHSFTLGDGYRFSPGVHYIGELGPGGRTRRIYEGLGMGGDLAFVELNPDGYDHILVGEDRFDIPRGKEAFAARLAARFPYEREGIHRYLDICDRLARELEEMDKVESWKDAVKLPLRVPTLLRHGLLSTQRLVDGCVSDPLLKAILLGQVGDHGVPPSQAPAALHGSVAAHYFEGGWYPRGGAYTIPRAYLRALRKAGGELRVRTRVERILTEGRRAIGVRLADGTEIRARHIVSNADPGVTYGQLVPREAQSRGLRRRLERIHWSTSCLSLFMAAEFDAKALGIDSGNYWIYDRPNIDEVYRWGMQAWRDMKTLPGFFLTVTTLKDPGKQRHGHHTMEAFTFVGHDAYREWQSSTMENRPEAYKALKDKLLGLMIATAGKVIPDLADKVRFAELGTPLTNDFYCAASAGNLYGTHKTLGQLGPFSWPIETELPGLTMCGASTIAHGVLGASMSGVFAARSILGVRTREILKPKGPELTLLTAEQAAEQGKKGPRRPRPEDDMGLEAPAM